MKEVYLHLGEPKLIDSDQDTDEESIMLGFPFFSKCKADLELVNRQREILGPYLNFSLVNNYDPFERLN